MFDPRAARKTSRYQRMRAAFLLEHPTCAACARRGIIAGADELDHVVPVRDAPDRFWDRSNMQGLCRPCHEAKTALENARPPPDDAEGLRWRERMSSLGKPPP